MRTLLEEPDEGSVSQGGPDHSGGHQAIQRPGRPAVELPGRLLHPQQPFREGAL